MKKITAFLLTAAFLLTFAACGSQSETDGGGEQSREVTQTADTSDTDEYIVYELIPQSDFSDSDKETEQTGTAIAILKSRLKSMGVGSAAKIIENGDGSVCVRLKPTHSLFKGKDEGDLDSFVEDFIRVGDLSFREGESSDNNKEELPVVLTGEDVTKVYVSRNPIHEVSTWEVSLEFSESGSYKFYDATSRLSKINGVISIWLDDEFIVAPTVSDAISGGQAVISGGNGGFTLDEAKNLAGIIESGTLPFQLKAERIDN
ncbi:MAG: hypothetical protein FWF82_02440 [Oscillospiraceae bacterium]|nr:hypothetical protein [Oscillospiraceae bacterium]